MEKLFIDVYEKFKLYFYKSVFDGIDDAEKTLTSTEVFCLEIVNTLGMPTISELTDFMKISQPNMAYRVTKLVNMGYLNRIQSKKDKREFYLKPTEKFFVYYNKRNEYIKTVVMRIDSISDIEDKEVIEKLLHTITDNLMPEVDFIISDLKINKIEKLNNK